MDDDLKNKDRKRELTKEGEDKNQRQKKREFTEKVDRVRGR